MKKVIHYRLICWGVCLALSTPTLYSQSLAYNQIQQTLWYQNPASVGLHPNPEVVLAGRWQWQHPLEVNAPVQYSAALQTGIPGRRLALGMQVHHTRLAARRQTRASLQVAYHLPVHEKYLFSVGLSGGALFQQRTLQNVPVLDPGDHIFEEEMVAQRWPQAQVGFMLTGPQGWGGISIPVFHFGPFATEESERFPVAFVGVLGRRFSIKDKLAVQTVAQVHVDPTRPVRADLQAQLQLGHILGVGLALSGVESLDGQIEYTLMEGVRMGYSVGLVRFGSQGSLPEAYRNSHEITLSIRPISFSRDMDRDRVTDWEDACPRLKGEPELQGCPSQ